MFDKNSYLPGDRAEATVKVSLLDGSHLAQHSLSTSVISNGETVMKVFHSSYGCFSPSSL